MDFWSVMMTTWSSSRPLSGDSASTLGIRTHPPRIRREFVPVDEVLDSKPDYYDPHSRFDGIMDRVYKVMAPEAPFFPHSQKDGGASPVEAGSMGVGGPGKVSLLSVPRPCPQIWSNQAAVAPGGGVCHPMPPSPKF